MGGLSRGTMLAALERVPNLLAYAQTLRKLVAGNKKLAS
jgi:hypothetical protein